MIGEKKKAGRPKGSKDRSVEVGVNAARCPACGSSERGAYTGSTVRQKVEGLFEGKPYNEIVCRRAKCRCGQIRIEKTFELI